MSGDVSPTETWDVFISFASPDRRCAVDLADQLKGDGWKVFLDQDALGPGDRWDTRLQDGVRGSRVVAVLLSERSSTAHYQREEIHLAIDLERRGHLRVVPVYLEGQPAEPAAWEFGLRGLQRIDFRAKGVAGTAEKLVGLLAEPETELKEEAGEERRSVGESLHGAALRIDRTSQWEPLRRICASEESALFLLHGPRRQNLDLFVSRIWHYLGPECGTHHRTVLVPLRVEFAMHRTHQYLARPRSQPFTRQQITKPVVILPVRQYTLQFITLRKMLEILPAIAMRLATTWGLEIYDAMHPRVHIGNVALAAGFDQHRFTCITEATHQWQRPCLQQRLATRELHQRRLERHGLRINLIKTHALAAMKSLRCVTPTTAQITATQAHKGAGQAHKRRLALNRRVDLMHHQRA